MKRACSLNTNTDELKRSGNPRSEYLTYEFPARQKACQAGIRQLKKQIIYV